MTQGSARSKVSAENGFEPLLYPIFFFFFCFMGLDEVGWRVGVERGKSNESGEGEYWALGDHVGLSLSPLSCSFVCSIQFRSSFAFPVPRFSSHFSRRSESPCHEENHVQMRCGSGQKNTKRVSEEGSSQYQRCLSRDQLRKEVLL